jgi:hypothetical protein
MRHDVKLMTETYKVLSAFLALKEFTVTDVQRLSTAKLATIRTVIDRSREYVELVGQNESSFRGGRFLRYRIKPGKIPSLRARLEQDLEEIIRFAPRGDTATQLKPPLELRTAEDALTVRFNEVTSFKDRINLLRIARIDLKGARASLKTSLIDGADPDECLQIENSITALENVARVLHQMETEKATLAAQPKGIGAGVQKLLKSTHAILTETVRLVRIRSIGSSVGPTTRLRLRRRLQVLDNTKAFPLATKKYPDLEEMAGSFSI